MSNEIYMAHQFVNFHNMYIQLKKLMQIQIKTQSQFFYVCGNNCKMKKNTNKTDIQLSYQPASL
jgi:hypothetical protein